MIRALRREDRAALVDLLERTDVFTKEEISIALELIDSVLENPAQRDYIIRVSEEEAKVEGYYCIGPTPATDGTYDLYWIAVDPALHGKGVGKRLDEHALDLVRQMGGRLLIAETSSQPKYEKTRSFYVARGYKELARIREYYRPGDDLVVYGRYLTHT
ncbi:MAG TPA: GNAT family N-acetyltransferase [Bacteroidota bacterium]|nr:GNAT family N-acetyltransferase [Bacteroidota bacterium]